MAIESKEGSSEVEDSDATLAEKKKKLQQGTPVYCSQRFFHALIQAMNILLCILF